MWVLEQQPNIWKFDCASWCQLERSCMLLGLVVRKVHTLHYDSISGYDIGGSLEDCTTLGRLYVQKVIDSLNDRFPDLPIFNAAGFFSPKHYPMDALDWGTLTEQWLNRLVIHNWALFLLIKPMRSCLNLWRYYLQLVNTVVCMKLGILWPWPRV